jgi:tetratricopeptide (TPR) repeat protein
MSQAQLAWPELSDSYVSLIESGKRTPAPSMVALLARKLECSTAYLMTGVTEEAMNGLHETLRYAQIALENGAADEARTFFAEVLAHPALVDLPALAFEARWGHARALEAIGSLDLAIAELFRAAEMISPTTNADQWAELHMALGRCYREQGDLATSIAVGERALDELTETGGPWTDAMVMLGATTLGTYYYRGDLVYAHQLAQSLIGRAEAIGSPRALMAVYWNAAFVVQARGDFEAGLKLAERAIALLGEENDPRSLGRLRMALATMLLDAHPEQAERARQLTLEAEQELAASSASTVDMAWCLTTQARAELLLDNPVEAAAIAQRATGLLAGTAKLALAQTLTILSEAHSRLGHQEEAVAVLFQAIEYMEKMEAHRPAARTWFDLAELLGAAGRVDGQKAAFERALSCMDL